MINLYRNLRSDFMKLRHTAIPWIHIIIPLLGAILFVGYFYLYPQLEDTMKYNMIIEITALVFPILIGTITGLVITNEEKTSHFQVMLGGQRSRVITYSSKLLTLLMMGSLSIILLMGLFIGGLNVLGLVPKVPYMLLFFAMLGLLMGNGILYVLHLFMSIKFGMGSSIFLGVIESILVIFFSNMELALTFKYNPWNWCILLSHSIMNAFTNNNGSKAVSELFNHIGSDLLIMLGVSAVIIVACLLWFRRWEGRNSYE